MAKRSHPRKATRSPKGGTTIGGTFYPGSRWIPREVSPSSEQPKEPEPVPMIPVEPETPYPPITQYSPPAGSPPVEVTPEQLKVADPPNDTVVAAVFITLVFVIAALAWLLGR